MLAFKVIVALLAVTATSVVHADPATVAFTAFGTAVTWGTVYQAAVVVYGLYSSAQARRMARRAQANAIEGRTSEVGSTDMARSVVYGERQVDGRVTHIVEPIDGQIGTPAGREPSLFIVKALECDHEVDRIIDIQFDGRNVGPFFGDPNDSVDGVYVSQASHFYKQTTGIATLEGQLPSNGIIEISGVAILEVQSLSYNPDLTQVGDAEPQTATIPPNERTVSLGGVVIANPARFQGRPFTMTYTYSINQPLVKVWFFRGAANQTACQRVIDVSAGTYNSTHTLTDTPYVVVEITPDVDKFPNGTIPYITATVQGKRGYLVNGGTGYSRNPADHIFDYLKSEIGFLDAEINLPLLQAAHAVCAESVLTHYEYPRGTGGEAGQYLPTPVYEPRYACDALLSTEAQMLDNLRFLLASMAGTAVYTGGQLDVYAGAAQVSVGALDESDFSSAAIQIDPFANTLNSFNSVRGRHTARIDTGARYAGPGGSTDPRKIYRYDVTDWPPYKSAYYVEEDGETNWEDIDLLCVSSPHQAQRIAKLLLHLNRNSLITTAEFKLYANQFSVGQVIDVSLANAGFDAKPFRIIGKKADALRNTVQMTLKEEPTAVYDWNYEEGKDPDPAPNTILTPPDEVETPTNVAVESGIEVADFAPDGSVTPIARLTWDRAGSYGILKGGAVEVWHKYGYQTQYEKKRLPGDTVRLDIPILRSLEVSGQIRFVNAIQINGDWVPFSHYAEDTPTQWLVGNQLPNAQFEYRDQWTNPLQGDYEYDGWDEFLTGVSSPTVKPIPYVYLSDVPNVSSPNHIGYIWWQDPLSWQPGRSSYWGSKKIRVKPGSRMVAFVDAWPSFMSARLEVVMFSAGPQLGPTQRSEVVTSQYVSWDPFMLSAPPLESYFKTVSLFIDVPDWAYNARLLLRQTQMTNWTEPNGGEPFPSYVVFHEPYIGYASPGQVTLPPWSA